MIVATYNIQRGRGIDFAPRLDRTIDALRSLDADVIALQEVLDDPAGPRGRQARAIADALSMHHVFCGVRSLGRASYGIALLSKLRIRGARSTDISVARREPRAVLHADLGFASVFVCHFGLGPGERAQQARRLRALLRAQRGPRVALGDFNEWSRGAVARELEAELGPSPLVRTHPAPLPLLPLDRVYSDLPIRAAFAAKSEIAHVASDHRPLVAHLDA